MDRDLATTLLYALGSLPFWTGQKKFQRFLRGQPGSFWKNETPLKPIYLNHHFYGTLRDQRPARVSRALQVLKRAGYVERTELSKSKPFPVLKLTGKGVLKYYNLLVLDRGIKAPAWWIHHVRRLEASPRSPIRTGGEFMLFSDRGYLTQAPASEPQNRIQDDKTIRFSEPPDALRPELTYLLEEVEVTAEETSRLRWGPDVNARTVASGDLRRELTHFSPRNVSPEEPNPYVLQGRLVGKDEDPDHLLLWLTLENQDEDRVRVAMPRERLDEETPVEPGGRYVIGPVRRYTGPESSGSLPNLQLKQEGTIQRTDRPGSV